MVCFPNGKINLGLSVTQRRPDGFHDIETIFYPLKGLTDILELVPAPGDAGAQLFMSGKEVAGAPGKNLVWAAYELLLAQYPAQVPPLHCYLHKLIPMGAGLGGGSADGAFMLQRINDYCRLGLDEPALASLALRLGSDCPFFLRNTPQYATGRGEILEPVDLDLSAYSLQLICPPVHVSTAEAFGKITPRPSSWDLRELRELPVTVWKDRLINDFEVPVFALYPELAAIKSALYAGGAYYAAMSGSGSALFGIFGKGRKADWAGEGAEFYFE